MEWQDEVGQICGPEHWWVATDLEGGEEVLPVSDHATPGIVLKRLAVTPDQEDCKVELRYGYGWRLKDGDEWNFSYHNDLDEEINDAARQQLEDHREWQAENAMSRDAAFFARWEG